MQSSRSTGFPSLRAPRETGRRSAQFSEDVYQRLQQRLAELERGRRQDFLTPAAITTLVLLMSGFLPALYPRVQPIMLIWLGLAVIGCGSAIWLNRANFVTPGIVVYLIAVNIFYAGAVFLTPVQHGLLSYQQFGAGNTYYFVLGVLPVFASSLLLDTPWPYVINILILSLTESAVWFLPHDASFDAFTQPLGGTLFLSGSVGLGQIMLFAFALAIVNTLRRAIQEATRATEIEEANQRIAARQELLEADIKTLQEAHSRIANGHPIRATLPSNSELFPVAISLNILVDRLAKLDRSEQELKRVEVGLNEATLVINALSQGDLTTQPRPTGTIVDGLLASLIQVQGQISAWVQGVSSALLDTKGAHSQLVESASDVVLAIRQLEASLAQLPPNYATLFQEIAALARQNSEQLLRLVEAVEMRERGVVEAITRIRLYPSNRPSLPFFPGHS